jgi:PAS domain S-box-containing protein
MSEPIRGASDPNARSHAPRLFEAVARATVAVSCEFDVVRLVDGILEQMRLLGAPVVALFGAEVERRELRLLGQLGMPKDLAARITHVPFDAPLAAARAALTGEPQVFDGLESLAPGMCTSREILNRTGTTSVFAFPLVADGRLIGVLAASHPQATRFSPEEQEALATLASVFASSLSAARAYEHDRLQMEGLRLATVAIATPTTTLRTTLENIVEHARALTGAGYVALGIVDAHTPDGPFDPWVFSGMGESDAERIGRTPRPVGLLGAVAREGQTIRVDDVARHQLFGGLPTGHPPLKSFLGVPVLHLGRPVGNLYLAKAREGGFSEADQRIVETLAEYAGIAIERANAHELVLREAARGQRELEALRANEERFRRLAELAPDVICRIRVGPTRVEYISPSVEAILGHPPDAYYRDPGLLSRQVHPFDRALLSSALRETSSHGPFTWRWLRPDGRIVWLESHFVPACDEKGNVIEVLSISRDVSARKQAEDEVERLMEQLRVQRASLQLVIENSPVGIILVEDALGNRFAWNREAERIFGHPLTMENGIDPIWAQILDARGAARSRDDFLVLRALRGEAVSGVELRVRASGHDTPVLVSAAPLRDERGHVAGAVVVFKDISAFKELERLRQEWTSIVAHDLRQPVNNIMLLAGVLANEVTDREQIKRVEHIRYAASQLGEMTDDLLDASRIDACQLSIRSEAVNLPFLARETVERFSDVAKRTRIEVRGDVPPIQGDALRLEEILVNLLSNARKYGYPGTPIDVTITRGESEIVVSVVNRGEGLTAEEIPSLFQRFARTERAKTVDMRGVGLGLYIAKGLVEAHGGRIWAESIPGETTTFSFALPIVMAKAA